MDAVTAAAVSAELLAQAEYVESIADIHEPSAQVAEDADDDSLTVLLRGQAILAREFAARLRRRARQLTVDDSASDTVAAGGDIQG